jgi:transposase
MLKSIDNQRDNNFQSYLNADAGFDVKAFRDFLKTKNLLANIAENTRNDQTKTIKYYLNLTVYKKRFKIERIFAHMDKFKRILVRFDTLAALFSAWLFLGAAIYNLRYFKIN